MKTKKLIVIGGPTGVGKTNFAISLAKKFKSEILSADARQFYKELNIGVAKPNLKELNTIKHHFIGHISIINEYSIGQYENDAINKLNTLFHKYDVIFMCGGSGLYIDAVSEGLNKFPTIDNQVKEKLNNELKTKGIEHLSKELKKIDLETYNNIDTKNYRRVLRALEVYRSSGVKYSYFKNQKKDTRNFTTLHITITEEREKLYRKINERVDKMIDNGLLNEVKNLYKYKSKQALNTIGYKELFKFLDQEQTFEEAIEEIKKNSRRYAKRQITWFSKSKHKQFNINDKDKVIQLIQNHCT